MEIHFITVRRTHKTVVCETRIASRKSRINKINKKKKIIAIRY